ncbi:hypothetical protein HMPREF0004_3676 [Achromobacter piechaudii ATCC 43553]|uniref:Uncharacterized protein n=1 Tax=Achromobacter piechaudii ATCC 43553 TaxID=742159 RepID=D4XDX9_9BURK|nr:hypothetical protein HMPREF0004_3676 [Achromobacter piechaudii ATCC 43553]
MKLSEIDDKSGKKTKPDKNMNDFPIPFNAQSLRSRRAVISWVFA